jgi:flagellar biosynthesis protein FlhA
MNHPSPSAAQDGARGWTSDLVVAAGLFFALVVILVPMPPALIDPLLVLNLAVSLLVLALAACAARPLDLSVFPSLLLVVTFGRLVLNVATTRLILSNAVEGTRAAGRVVETFGTLVAQNNPLVGLVVFAVIVVVQFVVITRGATRVSEVAARFQLDSLPGKQLAIDGELSAGLIDTESARQRRGAVSREADFYGAMDGASKFVRGDAVAGLVILLVNLAGGIGVGVLRHGMDVATAFEVFSLLTIGDGLAAQVPALMVSVGAALLVTRSAASQGLGADLRDQVFANGRMLVVCAVLVLLLAPVGLPLPALAVVAGACLAATFTFQRSRPQGLAVEAQRATGAVAAAASPELDVHRLVEVKPLDLAVGYRLLALVDESRGGSLVALLARSREKFATELGFVMPAVNVFDSPRLRSRQYSLLLRGDALGRWEAWPDGFLAVDRQRAAHVILGKQPLQVAGGLAVWIPASKAGEAEDSGLDLLPPAAGLALHLEGLVRAHASELLTREEVVRLVGRLRSRCPALVEDLVPEPVQLGTLQSVLQCLLREEVSIRGLEAIIEALGALIPSGRPLRLLVEDVRRVLSRTLCAGASGGDGKLHAVLLEPALEDFLRSAVEDVRGEPALHLDPRTTDLILKRLLESTRGMAQIGRRPVVITSPFLRPHLFRLARSRLPGLAVLSYDEVQEDTPVEIHGSVNVEGIVNSSSTREEVHV